MQTNAIAHVFETAKQLGGNPNASAAGVFGPEEMQVLQRMARSLAGSTLDPADLLHDAIERALRSWDSFDLGSNLFAWMRTIMYRLAIDQTRGRRRYKAQLERQRWDLAAPTEASDEEEATAWDGLGMEDIRWALAQLPDTLQRAYHQFAIQGLSYHEIAAKEGIPLATIGTRLLRARRKLRELLSERAVQRRAPLPLVPRLTGRKSVARAERGTSCGQRASLAA